MATDPSPLVPRPRPGFVSPDDRIASFDKMSLVAASVRAAAGALFVGVAVLYLPTQMWTPIVTGVGLLMTVNGSLAVWKVGRAEPRLRPLTRILVWTFPALCGVCLLLALILGPSALGPDWSALSTPQEPATFQPLGLPE